MVRHNSIKSLLVPLQKQWYLIVIFILLSAMSATRYLYVATPMYQASCAIKIADQESNNTNLYRDFDVFKTNNKVQTEVEVLRSHFLFEKALCKLDFNVEYYRVGELQMQELYHTCPFKVDFNTTDSSFYNQQFNFQYLGGYKYNITYKLDRKSVV